MTEVIMFDFLSRKFNNFVFVFGGLEIPELEDYIDKTEYISLNKSLNVLNVSFQDIEQNLMGFTLRSAFRFDDMGEYGNAVDYLKEHGACDALILELQRGECYLHPNSAFRSPEYNEESVKRMLDILDFLHYSEDRRYAIVPKNMKIPEPGLFTKVYTV